MRKNGDQGCRAKFSRNVFYWMIISIWISLPKTLGKKDAFMVLFVLLEPWQPLITIHRHRGKEQLIILLHFSFARRKSHGFGMTQYDRMLIFGASFKYFMVFWNDMQAGSVRCKGDPQKLKDVGHDSITSSAHQSEKYALSHTQKKSWKLHQIKGKQPFPVGKYLLMCFDVPLVLFCFYSGGGTVFFYIGLT